MRIIVNARFLIKDKLEGIGWFSHEVLRRMVNEHPEDEFIFLFDRPFDPSFIYGPNVKGVVLFPPARHPFLWFAWFEIAVANYLNKQKDAIFFSPDSYLSLRAKCKQVMVCHDIAFMHYPQYVPKLVNWYYRYFTPRFLNKADRIITVSDFVKKDISQTYGTALERIDVANNAARDVFKPLDLDEKDAVKARYTEGKPYFLYVGAIHPRKNVETIVKGFELFKAANKTDHKLVLLGRLAWQTDEFEKMISNSEYSDDIILPGYATSDELVRITAGAEAMLYMSKSEGFGIPLLEALKCDVPLIVSDKTSLPEVAGDAAIIVPVTDIKLLAVAMKNITEDESLRADLLAAGTTQLEKYTWEKAASVCYASIQKVTSSD